MKEETKQFILLLIKETQTRISQRAKVYQTEYPYDYSIRELSAQEIFECICDVLEEKLRE